MFQSNHQANNGNGHVTSHLQPDLHSSNLFDLGGQVAVVTGCDSSMGAMIARVMVSNGCRVYLVGCQLEQMQKMCKEFQSKDQGRCLSESKMIILQADLSSQEGCQKMKTEVEKHEKSIDILVRSIHSFFFFLVFLFFFFECFLILDLCVWMFEPTSRSVHYQFRSMPKR